MRLVLFLVAVLLFPGAIFASDIREFDIRTVERLGNELTRLCRARNRGASTPVKKLARKSAIAALKGRLFDIQYDYVVLDDPDESGFLVYAIAQSASQIVLGGHFRVTVSADGRTVERIDPLSHTLLFAPPPPKGSEGRRPVTVSMSQVVSNKPLETCVYTSLHDKVIVSVGMVNDNARVWAFVGDKIFEMTPELIKEKKK